MYVSYIPLEGKLGYGNIVLFIKVPPEKFYWLNGMNKFIISTFNPEVLNVNKSRKPN